MLLEKGTEAVHCHILHIGDEHHGVRVADPHRMNLHSLGFERVAGARGSPDPGADQTIRPE